MFIEFVCPTRNLVLRREVGFVAAKFSIDRDTCDLPAVSGIVFEFEMTLKLADGPIRDKTRRLPEISYLQSHNNARGHTGGLLNDGQPIACIVSFMGN